MRGAVTAIVSYIVEVTGPFRVKTTVSYRKISQKPEITDSRYLFFKKKIQNAVDTQRCDSKVKTGKKVKQRASSEKNIFQKFLWMENKISMVNSAWDLCASKTLFFAKKSKGALVEKFRQKSLILPKRH